MKLELTFTSPPKPPKKPEVPKNVEILEVKRKYEAAAAEYTLGLEESKLWTLTVNVDGKAFGDEYVGETKYAALRAFLLDMMRQDAQVDMIAALLKVKPAKAKAKAKAKAADK